MSELGEIPQELATSRIEKEDLHPQEQTWVIGAFMGIVGTLQKIQENPHLSEIINKFDTAQIKYRRQIALAITLVAIASGVGQISTETSKMTDIKVAAGAIQPDIKDTTRLPWETALWQTISYTVKKPEPIKSGKTALTVQTEMVVLEVVTPQEVQQIAQSNQIEQTYFNNRPSSETEMLDEKYLQLSEKYGITPEKAQLLDNKLTEYARLNNLHEVIPLDLIIVIGGIESMWTFDDIEHPPNKDKSVDSGPFGINSRFLKEDIVEGEKKWGREISLADAKNFSKAADWVIQRIYFIAGHDGVKDFNSRDSIRHLAKRYNGRNDYADAVLKRIRTGMPAWVVRSQ